MAVLYIPAKFGGHSTCSKFSTQSVFPVPPRHTNIARLNMAVQTKDEEYLMSEGHEEIRRLTLQHDMLKAELNGSLVFAPMNFSTPGLKILDCGCASGKLKFDSSVQALSVRQLAAGINSI